MVVVPGGVTGGTELAAILRRERITHATITPTALATVSEAVTESGAATGTGAGAPAGAMGAGAGAGTGAGPQARAAQCHQQRGRQYKR